MVKIDKMKKQEKRVYIETVIVVILVLLTMVSFVLALIGFWMPEKMPLETFNPLLTNLLLLFMIAELSAIILMVNRISSR